MIAATTLGTAHASPENTEISFMNDAEMSQTQGARIVVWENGNKYEPKWDELKWIYKKFKDINRLALWKETRNSDKDIPKSKLIEIGNLEEALTQLVKNNQRSAKNYQDKLNQLISLKNQFNLKGGRWK